MTAVTGDLADVLDLDALQGWLDGRLAGYDADAGLEVSLLAGGRSNLTVRLDQGEHSWALRRPPLGHVMASAHDVGREYRVMTGLGRVGFPVPTTRVACDDASVIGAPFFVMDFVRGPVLATAAETSALPAARTAAISAALVDTLAELHGLSPAAAGLDTLGRPHGYLGRQVRRWLGQWETTKTRELPGVTVLGGWLEERVPDVVAPPAVLVHGDYRLDNLILSEGLDRVAAVLDWEMATTGDALADLAVALVYWSEATDTLRAELAVSAGVTSAAGFWTREQIVAHYTDRTGQPVDDLDVYVALACLKLGVIMESIRFRALAGQQRGVAAAGADAMGRSCEALVELGLRVTRRGALAALAS